MKTLSPALAALLASVFLAVAAMLVSIPSACAAGDEKDVRDIKEIRDIQSISTKEPVIVMPFCAKTCTKDEVVCVAWGANDNCLRRDKRTVYFCCPNGTASSDPGQGQCTKWCAKNERVCKQPLPDDSCKQWDYITETYCCQ